MSPPPIPRQSPTELLNWPDEFRFQQLGTTHNRFIRGKPGKTCGTLLCLVRDFPSKFERLCPDTAILVLGLFQTKYQSSPSDEAALRFCGLAGNVFTARPDRRFLHAFHIYDSTVETWTFDRAGAHIGKPSNIMKEPHHIRDIIAGYMSMDDNALGLNSFLQEDDQGVFIELKQQN